MKTNNLSVKDKIQQHIEALNVFCILNSTINELNYQKLVLLNKTCQEILALGNYVKNIPTEYLELFADEIIDCLKNSLNIVHDRLTDFLSLEAHLRYILNQYLSST